MKYEPEFDFVSFIHEYSSLNQEEKSSWAGTPVAEKFGEFCKECEGLGLEEMNRRFPNEQEADTVIKTAISNAIHTSMTMSNSIESLAMLSVAMNSEAINHMLYSVFLFALGLSIKEELR